jgi:serine/threonine-protein kinase RsbW
VTHCESRDLVDRSWMCSLIGQRLRGLISARPSPGLRRLKDPLSVRSRIPWCAARGPPPRSIPTSTARSVRSSSQRIGIKKFLLFDPSSGGNLLTVEHRLPADSTAPGSARKLAADFLADKLPPERIDDFLLMLSEVVANAVRHGKPEPDGRIGLHLETDGSAVRAIIVDGAPAFTLDWFNLVESAPEAHPDLMVVDKLADRWGLTIKGKKAVWFEVDR